MLNIWQFAFIVLLYQVFLAGRDHMVTGILCKGLPPDNRFLSYVLWTSGENISMGILASMAGINTITSLLMFITIIACWYGGLLDFLYFMILGEIPQGNFVWHWMPKIVAKVTNGKITFEHPTTEQWFVWTCIWWIPMIISWVLVGVM